MKKALSVLLAVLAVFSCFAVTAFAADDLTKVTFYVDEDTIWESLEAAPGVDFRDRLTASYPVKAETETTEYTFKYWELYAQNSEGEWTGTNEYFYTSQIPMAEEGVEEVRYYAIFVEENKTENQSFWAFMQTIFARINMIFEYFAEVFKGVFDF